RPQRALREAPVRQRHPGRPAGQPVRRQRAGPALRAKPGTAFGALVDAVTATAAPSHTLAAVVLPGGRGVAPLLRVGATDNHVEALVKVVRDVARRCGAPARPVDGEHAPGVYATAPVGTTLGG
ncbi:hypothetical protein AB0I76_21545, partial [Micromonospora sp. NPDC049799]